MNSNIPQFHSNQARFSYPFQVKYAPKVKVNVMGSLPVGSTTGTGGLGGSPSPLGATARIVEHSQVRLECRADANPSDVRYRWFINDEPIIGGQKTEMVSGAPPSCLLEPVRIPLAA